jgi:hypothetical protein
MQWAWGLDSHHDSDTNPPAEPVIQQASVNILADMGAQPATLQAGLVAASPSADTTPPVSQVLTAPQTYTAGTLVTISGTATDSGGGVVAGVEASVDGGATWHPSSEFAASGNVNWTYSYTQTATGLVKPISRATDDSGNIEGSSSPSSGNPVPSVTSLAPASAIAGGPGLALTLTGSNFISSSTVLWNGQNLASTFISATQLSAAIPASDTVAVGTAAVTVMNPAPGGGTSNPASFSVTAQISDSSVTIFTTQLPAANGYNINPKSLEVGVRFHSDVAGQITAIRFYKVSGNSGQHSGHLWSNTGTLLGSVAFTGETATGWQTMSFPSPISIQANTTYVASYFTTTGYADTANFFATAGVDNPPLHAPQSSANALNGFYSYSGAPVFPSNSTNSTNYWVDVVFSVPGSTSAAANPVPTVSSLNPSSATAGSPAFTIAVNGSNFISSSTVLWNGQARATVFVSSTLLNASILAGDLASPATAAVAVLNPTPGGGTSTAATFMISASTPATGVLFSDDFDRPNGLISNEFAFLNPTSTIAVISPTWIVSGGSLFVSSGMAWTGIPDNVAPNAGSTNGTGSATLRVLSRVGSLGDITVSFGLTNLGFVTTPTTPAQSFDGVNLELRYESEQSYYYAAVNRRDNTVALKKVSAGTTTALASAAFTVPLNTQQDVQVSVHNNSGGSVTLMLSINGSQLINITDSATPLTAAGAVGFRGNNADFEIADFVVQSYGAAPLVPAGLRAPAAPAQTSGLEDARVYPNPWRADRYAGLPVTIDRAPPQSEIRFFTISGRWVKTVEAPAGIGSWDLTNDSGQRVGSGIYLYLITEPGGQRTSGTLAVMR